MSLLSRIRKWFKVDLPYEVEPAFGDRRFIVERKGSIRDIDLSLLPQIGDEWNGRICYGYDAISFSSRYALVTCKYGYPCSDCCGILRSDCPACGGKGYR